MSETAALDRRPGVPQPGGTVMSIVSIVFHSGIGHTANAADALAGGCASVAGVDVQVHRIVESQIVDGRWSGDDVLAALSASDAIVFGASTYMGMVSWPFKAFADATAPMWMTSAWKDKIAAGFTASGFPSGDKVMTLHYLATLAAQLRMVWVSPAEMSSRLTGDPRNLDQWGYYLGLGVVGGQPGAETDAGDLATAEAYGQRIAHATKRWTSGS
jgi:NAD(P)H dehydrogenase (quinone)